ncbi:MAG TPA: hypothetical protein VMG82_01940 [Candidatus Sulfotelmatobacter sp.]|nr:hypothetical protein [Candidatus Sulfotelmatobacter sp.]
MNSSAAEKIAPSHEIGRSILALVAGMLTAIILSLGTDLGLHAVGLTPPLGQPMSDPWLMLAAAYRTIYGVIASYIVARLAPNRPMQHALIAGFIGLVVSIAGAVATWNSGLGPHWYPLSLIVLALPPAWVGGQLREIQLRSQTAASTMP